MSLRLSLLPVLAVLAAFAASLGCSRSSLDFGVPTLAVSAPDAGTGAPTPDGGDLDAGGVGPAAQDAGGDPSSDDAGAPAEPIDADLPSAAACQTMANALWIEGQANTNPPGTGWLGNADATYAQFDAADVNVIGSAGTWDLFFNTEYIAPGAPDSVAATPLQAGVVYPVTFSNFIENLKISSPMGECSGAVGAFRLDEFSAQRDLGVEESEQPLLTLTAVFSVSCEYVYPQKTVIRGCVHFDSSNPFDTP